MKHLFTLLFLLLVTSSVAYAAGDAEAGKTKAATCNGCHGANGIGLNGTYPNLAGQHADYIVKQLKAFKSGSRKNALMSPMAAALSEQDMADIAAHFAGLPRDGGASASTGDSANATAGAEAVAKYQPSAAKGKSLYQLGDESRSIGACIGCHGKEGHSEVLIYPNLAKQHPEYIAKQLHNFKNKTRSNNYAMSQFAGNMTANDIADIAAYLKDPAAVANVKSHKVMPSAPVTAAVIAGKTKSATCGACHGVDGNTTTPVYPKLAGQSADYIVKQLQDFKSGARKNATMAPMAAGLSEQDMQEIASYYSAQTLLTTKKKGSDIGKKIYFGGHLKAKVTACAACHGADGRGMPNARFPVIAGQNKSYIKKQLTAFQKGKRHNDYNGMMQSVVAKLSKKDINELAKYIAAMK